MSTPTYYAGPGKVYWKSPANGTPTYMGFQPEGANGPITCAVEETTTTRGAAMYGDLFETLDDVVGRIQCSPFDNWSLLPYLFPSYLGVTTGGTNGASGVLAIGTNPHSPNSGDSVTTLYPAGVFTADGREYNFVRSALVKHPTVSLGSNLKMFSQIELACLGQLVISAAIGLPSNAGFLMTALSSSTSSTPITESGATDPDTTGWTTSDFGQSFWTGNWGAGAITGWDNFQGEDGFQIVPDVRYNAIKVQGVTRIYKLASSRFMIKFRPVGSTHTQLLAKVLAHTAGGILTETSAKDVVLTGSNGKTVTMKNAELKGAPFEFGGTKLNTGELAFVQQITVSSVPAVANPSLVFSA